MKKQKKVPGLSSKTAEVSAEMKKQLSLTENNRLLLDYSLIISVCLKT